MKNRQAASPASSWGTIIVICGIVLAGFSHGGCRPRSGESSGADGLRLISLSINGDPISVQVAMTATLTAIGRYSDGTFVVGEPATWSINPAGYATVDPATGLVTGVSPGLSYVTAIAIADGSRRGTALLNTTTDPPPPPTITTTSLANARQGVLYTVTLQRVNGQMPMGWSLQSGSLPAGMTLNSSTGIISGTCSVLGPSTFTVMVTDAVAASDTQDLTLEVVVNTGSSS